MHCTGALLISRRQGELRISPALRRALELAPDVAFEIHADDRHRFEQLAADATVIRARGASGWVPLLLVPGTETDTRVFLVGELVTSGARPVKASLVASTLERSPVALAHVDAAMRFCLVNPAFARAHGSTVDALIGTPANGCISELEAPIEQVRRSGEELTSHEPLRRVVNEQARAYDWTISPSPEGVVIALQDVTRRVAALEEVREAHNLLESVIAHVPTRVFWKDRDGVTRGCNQLFANDAGKASPAEVIGRTDYELAWSEQAELYRADDRKVIESGEPRLRYEEPQTTPDGSTLWLRTSKVPLRSATGETLGVLGIYEDITSERKVQDDLRAAKAEAEKASRAKSEFLANMSHEIRTPMNAVLGFAELSLQEPLTEPLKTYLGSIHDSATDLLSVINDILDFSKIEAGRLLLASERFSPRECLSRAHSMAETLVREKDVVVNLFVDPALPAWVTGDRLRMTQVLTNLVGNAVKFTLTGQVDLRADVLPPSRAGAARVKVTVRDTGIGTSPERVPHLFEPFTQADSSITRAFGGTGLGLAITRRLVHLMGGEFRFESAVGRGTTCTVTMELPLASAPGEQTPTQSYVGAFAGKRALLAEDNRINQMLGRKLLERLGFEVELAENGRRAVQLAASNPYDIIFMDMQMPELDGLSATREIRAARNDVPILAMTANAFEQDRRACLEAGMNEHLSKPLLLDVIGAAAARFLNARRGSETPRG